MLESFDPHIGTVSYHCTNPECRFHNCAAWEPWRICKDHDELYHTIIPAEEVRANMLKNGVAPEVAANAKAVIAPAHSRAGRVVGETQIVEASHEEIFWSGPGVVGLPMCECGTRMFLKVTFSPVEMRAPNITVIERVPGDPAQVQRTWQHPAVQRHIDFAAHLESIGNIWKGHENLAAEHARVEALMNQRLGRAT